MYRDTVFENNQFNIDEVRHFWISKFYKEMYVGGHLKNLITSKIHNVLDIEPIFLKVWIFTNFNRLLPVVVEWTH
jgi:hypothetical protein